MHARRSIIASVAAATALSLAAVSPAAASKAAKPGADGPIITLARHLDITGNSTDIVMTSDGTAYAGWIAANAGAADRSVSLCVLPPGAHACKGGVQTDSTAETAQAVDLKMLVVRGTPTLLWLHNTAADGAIAAAMVSPAGVLSAPSDVASGPRDGELLDAKVGPNNSVWTITYDALPAQHLEVHEGLTAAGKSIKTPWGVGFASLAFDHAKPIVVATDYGAIGTPPAYATGSGGGFTSMKNVAHTWAVGTNADLTTTSSGVRLTTAIGNASYSPVVAKWTGHGFGKPTSTGDKNPCAPDSHDTSTDKSGRLIDATNECGQITVADLPNTTRAALYRFKSGGTVAGDHVQIVSSPRGHAWVLWGIEDLTAGAGGTKLMVRPVLLPDRHASKSAHGKHGKVTVVGPASCLPADSISVGVSGHPDHGWKVGSKKLTLDGKPIGRSIDGAALTPGKKYMLKGSVTFTGGGHSTTTASLTFKACPKP